MDKIIGYYFCLVITSKYKLFRASNKNNSHKIRNDIIERTPEGLYHGLYHPKMFNIERLVLVVKRLIWLWYLWVNSYLINVLLF